MTVAKTLFAEKNYSTLVMIFSEIFLVCRIYNEIIYPYIVRFSKIFCAGYNDFAEYNQQDATFHSFFISVRRSARFRRVFRPSSGAQNCTYSVGYLSDQYCYLLLAWSEWKYRASYRNKEIVKRCILLAIRCEYVKFSQRLPILQNTGTRNKLI